MAPASTWQVRTSARCFMRPAACSLVRPSEVSAASNASSVRARMRGQLVVVRQRLAVRRCRCGIASMQDREIWRRGSDVDDRSV